MRAKVKFDDELQVTNRYFFTDGFVYNTCPTVELGGKAYYLDVLLKGVIQEDVRLITTIHNYTD